jgi:hypothetical protein
MNSMRSHRQSSSAGLNNSPRPSTPATMAMYGNPNPNLNPLTLTLTPLSLSTTVHRVC